MFKIDKSYVEYIDSNKSMVIIKQWVPRENLSPQDDEEQPSSEGEGTDVRVDGISEEDASSMLAQARQEAHVIIAKALSRAEEIKKAAWQEGYEKGQKECEEKLIEMQKAETQKWERFAAELAEFKRSVEEELFGSVLQLSLDIAEKIINTQLEKNDILFVGMVKKAISKIGAKEAFAVRLNPCEYERFFAQGTAWLQEELQCAPFSVIRDETVPRGGCVFETEDGVIKAGVDAQLKMIAAALNQDARPGRETEDE